MSRSTIAVALLGGAAIGLAVGVLLAPDKGSNTRNFISDQASGLSDNLFTLVDRILAEVERRARRESTQE
jgi:gas vesicle protein